MKISYFRSYRSKRRFCIFLFDWIRIVSDKKISGIGVKGEGSERKNSRIIYSYIGT